MSIDKKKTHFFQIQNHGKDVQPVINPNKHLNVAKKTDMISQSNAFIKKLKQKPYDNDAHVSLGGLLQSLQQCTAATSFS